MGRHDRAYQTVIIILAILFLAEGFAIWNYSTLYNDAYSAAETAKASAADADAKRADAVRDNLTMKKLIGWQDETEVKTIEDTYNEDMKRYMAGYPGTDNSYKRACEFLRQECDDRDKKILDLESQKTLLESNLNNMSILRDAIVESHEKEKRSAIEERDTQQQENQKTVGVLQQEAATIKDDLAKTKETAEEEIAQAKLAAEEMEAERNRTASRNKDMAKTLGELTRGTIDIPCGKVTGVNQGRGIVFIDRGHADGLQVRTIFTVYDPSITGISYPTPTDTVYGDAVCAVCKREMSLSASKASVEVTKILGEHAAECRILDDHLPNPILSGDVIFTPIWKPGQKQVFALTNGMIIQGAGKRDGQIGQGGSDLSTLVNLIRSNGGEVGAYIDENGNQVGQVNRDTSFLVLGDVSNEDPKGPGMERRAEMIKTAEELGIRVIRLNDLLRIMRWQPVTRVRGFGNYATESDIRMPPKTSINVSNGIVSPLYELDNVKARIKNSDRTRPESNGRVSDLYDKRNNAAGLGTSSGSVSDLFRPRKPAISKEEIEQAAGNATPEN